MPNLFYVDRFQMGDIILCRDDGVVSEGIRLVTGGDYSHAMVCINPPVFTEAIGENVWNIVLRNFYIQDVSNFCVLRIREDLVSVDLRRDIANSAIRAFSRRYSKWKAAAAVLPFPAFEKEIGIFCSMLVAECFDLAGITIVDKPSNKVTPADLQASACFSDVTSEIIGRAISQEEAMAYERLDGPRQHNIARESSRRLRQAFEEVYPSCSSFFKKCLQHKVIEKLPYTLPELVVSLCQMEFDILFDLKAGILPQPVADKALYDINMIDDRVREAIERNELLDLIQQVALYDDRQHRIYRDSCQEAREVWGEFLVNQMADVKSLILATDTQLSDREKALRQWQERASVTHIKSAQVICRIHDHDLGNMRKRRSMLQDMYSLLSR